MPLTQAALGRQRQVHPCILLSIQPAILESSRPSRRHSFKRMTTGLHTHEHIFLHLHMSAYTWIHAHIHTHTHPPKPVRFLKPRSFLMVITELAAWYFRLPHISPSGLGFGLGLGARWSYQGLGKYLVLQMCNGKGFHGHILNLPL